MLLCFRESLWRQLFVKERTFGTTGPSSSATACSIQKPMGESGALSDRIFRCIKIEHRIQDEANAAILGVNSAESGHSHNDGDSALLDIVADDAFNDVGDDGDEDDDEVVAVNAADENVASVATTADANVAAVATASPRPQALPAFVGGGVRTPSAVSTLARWGG